MKKIISITSLLIIMLFSMSVSAQTETEKKLIDLANENIVMLIAKVADVAAMKAGLDAKELSVAFASADDIKGKKTVEAKMKIISLNSDNADFAGSTGVVVLEGEFTEGNTKFFYSGNLSLVTLKGMGNLDVKN